MLYDSCTKAPSDVIKEIQLEVVRTATGAKRRSSHAALYFELGWISLSDRSKMHKMCTILNHLKNHIENHFYIFYSKLEKIIFFNYQLRFPIMFQNEAKEKQ